MRIVFINSEPQPLPQAQTSKTRPGVTPTGCHQMTKARFRNCHPGACGLCAAEGRWLVAGVPARDLQGQENAGAKSGLGEDRRQRSEIGPAIATRRKHQGAVGTKARSPRAAV